MSSWPSSESCGPVPLPPPDIEPGLSLCSPSFHYSVLEVCGEGMFGKVASCRNQTTSEIVAVKFVKSRFHIKHEVSMLEAISVLDLDKSNLLKFMEQFDHQGLTCLVFEMLDLSLSDWLWELEWTPQYLESIRPIAKQLFVALDGLRTVGILHTDIKPDNIMFVNMQDQPLRLKLIDFGLALPAAGVRPGMGVQPLGYRAPEVVLGLPFNEAIDIWGAGCILAYLYLAIHLFNYSSEYQLMKAMVHLLGQPGDHMLRAGINTQRFFLEENAAAGPGWRLMTPEEHSAANSLTAEEQNTSADLPSSLEYLLHIYDKEDDAEFEDRMAFVDLLTQLLHLDPDHRMSAQQALEHPFITMEHLRAVPDGGDYLTSCQAFMSEPWISDGDVPPVSHPERLDDGAARPSDGGVHQWSSDGDLESWSSDGADPPAFAPDVSASSDWPTNILQRVGGFFEWITSPFCCCWSCRSPEDERQLLP